MKFPEWLECSRYKTCTFYTDLLLIKPLLQFFVPKMISYVEAACSIMLVSPNGHAHTQVVIIALQVCYFILIVLILIPIILPVNRCCVTDLSQKGFSATKLLLVGHKWEIALKFGLWSTLKLLRASGTLLALHLSSYEWIQLGAWACTLHLCA